MEMLDVTLDGQSLVLDVRVLGEEHGTDLGNLVSRGIYPDVPAEMDGVSLFIDNVSRMVTISCSADASLSTSVYVYDSISIDEFWRYCTKEGGTTYLDGEALYNG